VGAHRRVPRGALALVPAQAAVLRRPRPVPARGQSDQLVVGPQRVRAGAAGRRCQGAAGVGAHPPPDQGHPAVARHRAGRRAAGVAHRRTHCVVGAIDAVATAWARGPGRRAGPLRAADGPHADRHRGGRTPVPQVELRHRAARLLRRRPGPPGQARHAGPVRLSDVPGRAQYRLPGGGRPAVWQGLVGCAGRQGEDRLRAGRAHQPGLSDRGQDLQPPAHPVRHRPRPAGGAGGQDR
jgi:hypothetical protein